LAKEPPSVLPFRTRNTLLISTKKFTRSSHLLKDIVTPLSYTFFENKKGGLKNDERHFKEKEDFSG
jgi:hypothetical protein